VVKANVRGITPLLALTSAAANKPILSHYLARYQAKQFNKLSHPPTRRGVNTPLFYRASICSQVEPDKYTLLRPLSCNTYPEAMSPPAKPRAAGFVPNPCILLLVPITEDLAGTLQASRCRRTSAFDHTISYLYTEILRKSPKTRP
jgi:hypothetical protein